MMNSKGMLNVQETDAITERIESVSHRIDNSGAKQSVESISALAWLGSYIVAHADEITAMLNFAAFGEDKDETSDWNAIQIVALLALTDSRMRDALIEQFDFDQARVDSLRTDLLLRLEDNPFARRMETYLAGFYGTPLAEAEAENKREGE